MAMRNGVSGGARLVAGMAFGLEVARAVLEQSPEADITGQQATLAARIRAWTMAPPCRAAPGALIW
jgi:hypothetical protein